jgi:glycerate kinase
MALKVLIIPDKFKGTLTAQEAAQAMAAGWRASRPDDDLELLPMSDGGDGFGEIISHLLGAEARATGTVDAAHRTRDAVWWWHEPSRTAVVESARVIGLALLPAGRFHPFELDTAGLGTLLREARGAGAQRCLVGIGGSATNDAGFGLARALGWQFLDAAGTPLAAWTQLDRLDRLRSPAPPPLFPKLVVAVDVQNPLLGPTGCSRIYGPQKGLRPEDFPQAERCLARLVEVVRREVGLDWADAPGAGAAGGLGYGLGCFAGGRLEPGFALFARYARLNERLDRAHVVLTGEGAIDASTLMGKGVGEVARLCQTRRVPCLGLAGVAPQRELVRQRFTDVYALTPDLTSAREALDQPRLWLEQLAARVACHASV